MKYSIEKGTPAVVVEGVYYDEREWFNKTLYKISTSKDLNFDRTFAATDAIWSIIYEDFCNLIYYDSDLSKYHPKNHVVGDIIDELYENFCAFDRDGWVIFIPESFIKSRTDIEELQESKKPSESKINTNNTFRGDWNIWADLNKSKWESVYDEKMMRDAYERIAKSIDNELLGRMYSWKK